MDTLAITLQASGGLGLFLLGMVVMTEGLRALAGHAMRGALTRFTRSPLTGALTGAGVTAVMQSSSATTVAAVGFVSAGLLSFPQALGIIFGANIGSTFTGWIVTLVGFKFQLGTLVLPLILVGVLLRLFNNGRGAQLGLAVAGFGLIFVGIAAMQGAVAGLQGSLLFLDVADSWGGRLQLIAVGILFTLLTQASSAGVAVTLTALYAGSIQFHQAAALVIGMDVGTTVTAALATLGGSVATRRTGLSHGIYNLMTAVGASLFIDPYIWVWEHLNAAPVTANAEVALVAFHTTFNTLGVAIVLPFTRQFAHLMERLIPEHRPLMTHGLDSQVLKEPSVAITAAHAVLCQETLAMLDHLRASLDPTTERSAYALYDLRNALNETQLFVDAIHLHQGQGPDWDRLYSSIHTLDHLQRLYHRFQETERAQTARTATEMAPLRRQLHDHLGRLIDELNRGEWAEAEQLAQTLAQEMETQTEALRDRYMAMVASDLIGVEAATEDLRALRWLNRVSSHLARITHHLQRASAARA